MIGFSPHDGHGAVKLFDEDEAYHLVGEGHLGKRELLVSPLIYIGREPVWTAYDEDKTLADCVHLVFQIRRELYAAHLLASLIKEHYPVTRLQLAQDEFAFKLFLLVGGEVFGVLEFGDNDGVKPYVVLDT